MLDLLSLRRLLCGHQTALACRNGCWKSFCHRRFISSIPLKALKILRYWLSDHWFPSWLEVWMSDMHSRMNCDSLKIVDCDYFVYCVNLQWLPNVNPVIFAVVELPRKDILPSHALSLSFWTTVQCSCISVLLYSESCGGAHTCMI